MRGPGTRLTIATFLLLGSNPTGAPFYKRTVHRGFLRLVDRTIKEPIEIEPETVYRPTDLAASLGVDPRTVRGFLRERYPRETEEKGENWLLDADQAQVVVERFDESETFDQCTVATTAHGCRRSRNCACVCWRMAWRSSTYSTPKASPTG